MKLLSPEQKMLLYLKSLNENPADIVSPEKQQSSTIDVNNDDLESKYLKYISTTPEYTAGGAGDIYTTTKSSIDKAKAQGKSTVGAGMLGALAGILNYANTSEGKKIMSGLMKNPYSKKAMLDQALQTELSESAKSQQAQNITADKMKQIGEYLGKKQEKQGLTEKNALDTLLKIQAQQAQEEQFVKEFGLKEKELAQKQAEFEALPEKEQKKAIQDSASEAFKKGKINEEDYMKIIKEPNFYRIKSNKSLWNKLFGGGKGKVEKIPQTSDVRGLTSETKF